MINTLYTSVLLSYDAHEPVATTAAWKQDPTSHAASTREAILPRTLQSMQKALRLAFSSVLG